MSMYAHFAIEQAVTQLSDTYRILDKIKGEPLVEEANKKILSSIEDIQKVSEGISQQLEERR